MLAEERLSLNRGDRMKRALISVYDKTGIVEFARELKDLNWEIISTGGTSKLLKENGIEVIEIDELTGFPEILGGRVKTLNPRIHAGILYKRDDENHVSTMDDHELKGIDLVVNNLYPFEETLKKEGISSDEIIENIDIGGPSMIRAAAKNYGDVTVLVDPRDYSPVLEGLKSEDGISLEKRRALAAKVFTYTAYYDSLIAEYFNDLTENIYPDYLTRGYKKDMDLRYGENPQQKAAFYKEAFEVEGSLARRKQLHGKELSFNNINDSNGAIALVKEFDQPAVVAVKHANPSGVGLGENIKEAYIKAYECDDMSIFGGIIAANREIDVDVAEMINEIFIEVVLAPSFSQEALEILKQKKNIRLIEIENLTKSNYESLDSKKVLGGILLQEQDGEIYENLECVTDRKPTEEEMEELIFAWKVVKHVNSNGVVVTKDKATLGLGLGEVNRFWATENALKRSGDGAEGAVLASDGFFPFKDSIEILGQHGIKAIIQPGGSIKDQEVIDEANRQGIAMVFTGMRHFKH